MRFPKTLAELYACRCVKWAGAARGVVVGERWRVEGNKKKIVDRANRTDRAEGGFKKKILPAARQGHELGRATNRCFSRTGQIRPEADTANLGAPAKTGQIRPIPDTAISAFREKQAQFERCEPTLRENPANSGQERTGAVAAGGVWRMAGRKKKIRMGAKWESEGQKDARKNKKPGGLARRSVDEWLQIRERRQEGGGIFACAGETGHLRTAVEVPPPKKRLKESQIVSNRAGRSGERAPQRPCGSPKLRADGPKIIAADGICFVA